MTQEETLQDISELKETILDLCRKIDRMALLYDNLSIAYKAREQELLNEIQRLESMVPKMN
jgi:hypothetical protein